LSAATTKGEVVSATATDLNGNTSEFSAVRKVRGSQDSDGTNSIVLDRVAGLRPGSFIGSSTVPESIGFTGNTTATPSSSSSRREPDHEDVNSIPPATPTAADRGSKEIDMMNTWWKIETEAPADLVEQEAISKE
jgi:hypothetical protein